MIIKYLVCFVTLTGSFAISIIVNYNRSIICFMLLIAYVVLVLLLTIFFWQYEVYGLKKKNNALSDGLKATKKSRDSAQNDRDKAEKRYANLQSNMMLVAMLKPNGVEDRYGKQGENIQNSSDS